MVNTSVFTGVHGSISDGVDNFGAVGAVDGDLLVVGSESVSVGVGVGEESSLEHLIEGGLHSGNEVSW